MPSDPGGGVFRRQWEQDRIESVRQVRNLLAHPLGIGALQVENKGVYATSDRTRNSLGPPKAALGSRCLIGG